MNRFIKFIGVASLSLCIQLGVANADEKPISAHEALLKAAYEKGDIEFFQKTLSLLLETQPENAEALQAYANRLQGIEIQSAPTPEVEEVPLEVEETKLFDLSAWGASAEAGFAASSGDNSEQSLSLGMNLSRVFSETWDHAFELDIDFARAQGITSKERYFADYQVFYRAWDQAYAFVFAQAEHDKFSGFDYQIAESLGVGYTILDNEKHQWSVEGGPGVRHNKLEDNGIDNEFIGLLNNKYRYIFSESLSAGNETKLFLGTTRFSADNIFDVRARFTTKLSAAFSFQYKYDSNVPVGRKNTDTLTKATLVYDF